MNQKEKIIILFSSISLGLTILLIPFLGKNNSPKNHHQPQIIKKNYQKNNQRLNQKKKKSPLFRIIFIVSVITIIIVIFIIREIMRNYRRQKYLSGKCYLSCGRDYIHLYLCTDGQVKDDLKEQLYNLDIQNKKNIPKEFQEIYADLRNEKNRQILIHFGELINNFFKLIDGRLLYKIKDFIICKCIKNSKDKINEHLENDWFIKNNFEIYEEHIDIHVSRTVQKNKDSMLFFKSAVNYNDFVTEYEINNEKYFFFYRYHFVCSLISELFIDIKVFFDYDNNYLAQHQTQYQNIIAAKKAIDNFFRT